jgi:hypothetical protein
VLLIFNRGLNNGFFAWRHAWLIAGILLYIGMLVLGEVVSGPSVKRMLALAEQGAPKAEVLAAGSGMKMIGPFFPLATITVAVLMIWKPGSGCGALLRC